MSIFLLNFFLGWTVVGWIAAFIWACASDRPAYVHYVPVSAGHYCSRCGALAPAAPISARAAAERSKPAVFDACPLIE